jgi:CelD/BcsL family acetyltransferase involved in cellulose biosynthesis
MRHAVGIVAERVRGFDDVRPWWDRVACELSHPFALPDWLEAWWEAFGRGRELRLYVCSRREGGEPVAFVPLLRGDDGVVRFVGDGLSDELGPVCPRGSRHDAKASLAAALALELRPGERFVGTSLPLRNAWTRYPGCATRRIEACPFVDVATTTWHDYLTGPEARRRRRAVARFERQAGEGEVTIEEVAAARDVDSALSALFELHAARWGERSTVFAPSRRSFFVDASRGLFVRGALRLRLASVAGTQAGAMYCLRWAGGEWFYQSGWDPRFGRVGIGSALFAHSIRRAFGERLAAYRFLRGNEPYKWQWATADDPVVTIEVAANAA